MDNEFQKVLEDREKMPIYDESIFYPEKMVKDLGFTDEDINEITQFFLWHINQRNRGTELKNLWRYFALDCSSWSIKGNPTFLPSASV